MRTTRHGAGTFSRVRRLRRQVAERAYEAELRQALLPLAEAFDRWRRREVTSFELSDLIHKFHQGPNRELYVRYSDNHPDAQVAYAIVTGLIERVSVPEALLEHLARWIGFYEEQQARDSQRKEL